MTAVVVATAAAAVVGEVLPVVADFVVVAAAAALVAIPLAADHSLVHLAFPDCPSAEVGADSKCHHWTMFVDALVHVSLVRPDPLAATAVPEAMRKFL